MHQAFLAVQPHCLLSCFAGKTESKDAFYFVGMFRITNIEFLPEYRQKESREFLSVAKTVQQVVRLLVQEHEGGDTRGRGGGWVSSVFWLNGFRK